MTDYFEAGKQLGGMTIDILLIVAGLFVGYVIYKKIKERKKKKKKS